MQRIHEVLDAWLARDPARPFLHRADRDVDFASLGALTDALERELRADGIRRGDRDL